MAEQAGLVSASQKSAPFLCRHHPQKEPQMSDVTLTPLAIGIMVGTLPRTTAPRLPLIDKALDAKVGAWARSKHSIGEDGHCLWHKLRLSARQIDQWRHIQDQDPTKIRQKACNYICTVYGGSAWGRVEQAIKAVQSGDTGVLNQPLQVVENHAESDPGMTRLMLCDADVVPWATAALLDLSVEAWVGFSAIRHDRPRFNAKPSMCGLTVELAARVH